MHERALQLDADDPLGSVRDQFVIADAEQVYLDGNSLGRPPRAALEAAAAAGREWADGLVGSWHEWIELPRRLGATVGDIVGAEPDSVLVSDQTSLNLYKLAAAALRHNAGKDIVTTAANFPSDIYVLAGVADQHGGRMRFVPADPAGLVTPQALADTITPETSLVSFSHVDFKTGALRDLPGLTDVAHAAGALVLWDLSHSAGVLPVELAAAGADLAVGCTYKYLNGGPGAPAFLYVAPRHQNTLQQPIQGWFGHRDMFSFATDYAPAAGIERYAVGTPPILSLRAAEAGIAMVAELGIGAIRRKSLLLTDYLIDLIDQFAGEHELQLATPRRREERGGHVSVRHPDAYRISQALLRRGVVPDFREPDILRLAPSPLYTRFQDVAVGMRRLRDVMEAGEYRQLPAARRRVT